MTLHNYKICQCQLCIDKREYDDDLKKGKYKTSKWQYNYEVMPAYLSIKYENKEDLEKNKAIYEEWHEDERFPENTLIEEMIQHLESIVLKYQEKGWFVTFNCDGYGYMALQFVRRKINEN